MTNIMRGLTVLSAVLIASTAWAQGNHAVIRFATLTSISKAPPGLAAKKEGFFKTNHVKVHMKLFTSGKSAVEALAAGQYDIAMIGGIPALALLGRGFDGKIIAAGNGGPKRQAIVVRKGAPYKSITDLRGKTIGLTEGSTDVIALGATLKAHGMSWSAIKQINMSPPAKASALATGNVDAIEAWEPVPSIIVTKGIGRRLCTAQGYVPDIVGVVIANDKLLKSHPKRVVRFLRALHEGAVYARKHPSAIVPLLVQSLKLKKQVVMQAIPTQWWYVEVYKDTIGDWQRSADLLLKVKALSSPLHVEKYVDLRLLDKALGKQFPLNKDASEVMKYPTLR